MQFIKLLILSLLFLSLASCRTKKEKTEEKKKDETEFFSSPPESVPELTQNRLMAEPTTFLRNQSDSVIHWQPWTPQALDLAKRSQKLIFLLVGSSTSPEAQTLTKLLERKFASEINEQYVPVMADSELDPALALACSALATERREPISFPFLAWLTHEGNPVAWIPVKTNKEENLLIGFRRAQNTVLAVRNDSALYVVENGRFDNDGRLERLAAKLSLTEEQESNQPTRTGLFLTAQALSDLYDSIDRTFDNTAGIPPGNLITTLARVSEHPAAPKRLQNNARKAAKESVELLATSAIRDPLDGYFFARRNSRSFAVPALSKTLATQAEMLSALVSSPPTDASLRARDRMLAQLASQPLQSSALESNEMSELAFFWNTKALQDLLSPEEMTVAEAAFQLRSLGNVPSGDDPRRLYFRRNSLGLALFGKSLAKEVGMNEADSEKLLASAIDKISARRQEILTDSEALLVEELPTLAPRARLLTSLARSYAVSPQPATLQSINGFAEEIFTIFAIEDGKLRRAPVVGQSREVAAFAHDYAVTIEALLEVYRVTWEERFLTKAASLTTILLDNFLNEDNYLVEVKVENYPLTFPILSDAMIFGTSTWGISHGILKRMASLGYQHPKLIPAIETHTPLLENGLKKLPIVHTDYLLAALNNLSGYVLVVSKAHQNDQKLRLSLAQAEFDSVCAVLPTASFGSLPAVGGNAAILLQNGKQVASYSTHGQIASGLRKQLSK